MTGRFAPSTTGLAHPGTLLAALLAWLDARSRGERFLLRFDDADPQRCRPEWTDRMRDDLGWFGLDWDDEQSQVARQPAHVEALDGLAARGLLYACTCSRTDIRSHGRRAPDGGWHYPGTCRDRLLAPGAWQTCGEAVRLRLPDQSVALHDEGGADLGGHPLADFGDPVVVRRDGAVAYQLSVVLDDAAGGIDRVVRGRDLALHSAMQAQLHDVLGLARPVYRHHLLLMEDRVGKMAKFHQAVDTEALRHSHTAPELCGLLAAAAGLGDGSRCTPTDLLPDFDWQRVATRDRIMLWRGGELSLGPALDDQQTADDG